jgi:exodeoxyribonuclease-3
MSRLTEHARSLLNLEEPLVLAGDYNVIPDPRDAADPAGLGGRRPVPARNARRFRELANLGLQDALRLCDDRSGVYSFWDYQAGAWGGTRASASTTS